MSCPHRFDVDVYVLGALDPSERGAFEQHLAHCTECRAAMAANATLPGILARAPEPDTTGPDLAVPPAVLTGALGRVRRRRRVGRLLVAGAVLVALAGGLAVGDVVLGGTTQVGDRTSGDGSSVGTAREVSLPGVGASPSSGLAGLTAMPWGTEVALRCRTRRAAAPAPTPTRAVYVLVVVATDGGQQEIARWSPPPGQDVAVAASTDLPEDRVAGLEVRTSTGQVVMRS